jgi:hypothetical protein
VTISCATFPARTSLEPFDARPAIVATCATSSDAPSTAESFSAPRRVTASGVPGGKATSIVAVPCATYGWNSVGIAPRATGISASTTVHAAIAPTA